MTAPVSNQSGTTSALTINAETTLGSAVAKLTMAKGTLRFPLERPPTAALLKRIAKARLAQLRD